MLGSGTAFFAFPLFSWMRFCDLHATAGVGGYPQAQIGASTFHFSLCISFLRSKIRSGRNWMDRAGRNITTGASYGQACVEAALTLFFVLCFASAVSRHTLVRYLLAKCCCSLFTIARPHDVPGDDYNPWLLVHANAESSAEGTC